MCGIVGLISPGTREQNEAVIRARDLLAHRGPEGAGLWTTLTSNNRARVTLGHRRLCIIDVAERSSQPLLLTREGVVRPALGDIDIAAKLCLIYNGEIYNFVKLRTELISLGHRFNTTGDAEVLLLAYAEWGEECLERLNGMFAFAIWDSDRDLLFCARDRFGEKPFHYVLDEERGIFAFASEIKALIGMGVAEAELDERAVYRYFRFGEQAGVEQTIWRGVKRLAPAHQMTVGLMSGCPLVTRKPYWELATRTRRSSDSEIIAKFRDLFADSVSLRLRSDVPVGTSLSGGLDSSSVVSQISALGVAQGQHAFTAVMDDPELDESRYARIVATHSGVVNHTVVPGATALADEFDRLFYHQEEPFPSTSIFASYLVQRLAREHGVTVLLDGQGADEYLAGYSHYPSAFLIQLARSGDLLRWWRERRSYKARSGADPVPPRVAAWQWWNSRSATGECLEIDQAHDVFFLRPEFAAKYVDESARAIACSGGLLASKLETDLLRGHLQELLRYADRNSMAFSRETRLPFLDHRLVELVMASPVDVVYRNGESKWVLRRAMQGIVPQEILGRGDKIGFTTPWASWTTGTHRKEFLERLVNATRQLSDYITSDIVELNSSTALSIMAIASARSQLRGVRPDESVLS